MEEKHIKKKVKDNMGKNSVIIGDPEIDGLEVWGD